MMNNWYLVRGEKFEKDRMYEVINGKGLNKRRSVHCEIRAVSIPNIRHYVMIIAHHPLGGELGACDSYDKNLKLMRKKDNLDEAVLNAAKKYFKKMKTKPLLKKDRFYDYSDKSRKVLEDISA